MLTPKQAAGRMGVSDSLIYEWCSDVRCPTIGSVSRAGGGKSSSTRRTSTALWRLTGRKSSRKCCRLSISN